MAIIKAEHLKYRYPNTEKLALNDISLEIEKGEFIGIAFLVDNARDANVYDHFGTHYTWLMGTIQCCAVNRHTKPGCLNDGVLFGMNRIACFLTCTGWYIQFSSEAFAAFDARPYAGRSAIVTCSHDPLVLNDDRTDLPIRLKAACPS